MDAAPSPEIDQAVADGILITQSALTMAVKNHIIIGAITEDRAFDRDEIAAFTRDELRALSEEQVDYAERANESALAAVDATGPSQHRHDYRAADASPLRQRQAIYEGLARELLRLSADTEFLAIITERARSDAWDEISDALLSRLEQLEQIGRDPLYEKGKRKRLRELRKIDLRALRKR
jgi:hypothetical protein